MKEKESVEGVMSSLTPSGPDQIINAIITLVIVAAIGFVLYKLIMSVIKGKDLSEVFTKNPERNIELLLFFSTILEVLSLMSMAVSRGVPLLAASTRYVILGIIELLFAFIFTIALSRIFADNKLEFSIKGVLSIVLILVSMGLLSAGLISAETDIVTYSLASLGLIILIAIINYLPFLKSKSDDSRGIMAAVFFSFSTLCTYIIWLAYMEAEQVVAFQANGLSPFPKAFSKGGEVEITAFMTIWATPILTFASIIFQYMKVTGIALDAVRPTLKYHEDDYEYDEDDEEDDDEEDDGSGK